LKKDNVSNFAFSPIYQQIRMFEDKGIVPGAPDEALFELSIQAFGKLMDYYFST